LREHLDPIEVWHEARNFAGNPPSGGVGVAHVPAELVLTSDIVAAIAPVSATAQLAIRGT